MDTILHLQGNQASDLTPLFLIHPISGLALSYLALGELSEQGQRPVFGINSPMYARAPYRKPNTLEELALNYVKLLQEVQPQGPYLLGGWSMGGMIAMQMAVILERAHERILHVVMIDSINPNTVPPFQTVQEHEELVEMTYSRLVNASQALSRPRLCRSDSSSTTDSDYSPYGRDKYDTCASVTEVTSLSSYSSQSTSEVDLSSPSRHKSNYIAHGIPDANYADDEFAENDMVQMNEGLSSTETLDRMKKHISNGLWLIAGKTQGRQGKDVSAPVTQFKCSILEDLPDSISAVRKQAIRANFADSRCGWKIGRLKTVTLNSSHDRVFDLNHVNELTLGLRTLLKTCA